MAEFQDYRFTDNRQWVAPAAGGRFRTGCTYEFLRKGIETAAAIRFRVKAGDDVQKNHVLCVIDGPQSQEEVRAPFAGAVTALHEDADPDVINCDADGVWLIELTAVDPDDFAPLLGARAFCALNPC